MTTARDVLTAAEVCQRHALRHRQDADQLLRNALPPALDQAAHTHNVEVAHGHLELAAAWAHIEAAHREYAAELAQPLSNGAGVLYR